MIGSREAVILDRVVKKGFFQMKHHFSRDLNEVKNKSSRFIIGEE